MTKAILCTIVILGVFLGSHFDKIMPLTGGIVLIGWGYCILTTDGFEGKYYLLFDTNEATAESDSTAMWIKIWLHTIYAAVAAEVIARLFLFVTK